MPLAVLGVVRPLRPGRNPTALLNTCFLISTMAENQDATEQDDAEQSVDEQDVSEDNLDESTATFGARMHSRLTALIEWARSSRLRMALTGLAGLLIFGSIFALWSYLAHIAINMGDPAVLEKALAALDDGKYEAAKTLIGRMQGRKHSPDDFGGALFVLGAVKAHHAEGEWSAERRRAFHLAAARYFQMASTLGVSSERESQLSFLLGRSLILGNQPREGIKVLNQAIHHEGLPTTEIHTLLAEANLEIPDPDLAAALRHNEALLRDPELTVSQQYNARIVRAEILGRLGRIEEAFKQLSEVGGQHEYLARVKNVSGQLAVAEAERLPANSTQRKTVLDRAISDLRESQRLDTLSGALTRQSMYWIGKCYELQNDFPAAINQYDQIGKLFGDSSESVVATLSKADLARFTGNRELALTSYRQVLETVRDPVTYANRLLPLSELRKRLTSAHASFVESKQFSEALTLLEQFPPLFNQIEVIELRGKTHEQWGISNLKEAPQHQQWRANSLTKQGRFHLRAAGRAYETLAQMRFATRHFTDDLWHAADDYFQGQSYTHAVRILEDYLQHEAEKHNAAALLKLGQSLLANNKTEKAIEALEECIELYPRDAVVYQARIDCVRAYRELNEEEKAERLLLTNLTGETLTPKSKEWRDSLFALGQLLHDLGRYQQAIAKLEEAVARYPDSSHTLMAKYTIARSFHNAAEAPAQKVREAKTESDRQKNRKLRDQNLEGALKNYMLIQRQITVEGHGENTPLMRNLLRNCYMMQGSALFQLRRYEEARRAYANVSTLYQSEPFVLESFVHIANCWRRLNQPLKARGTIEQAKLVLQRLPPETNFKIATNFNRQQWQLLLDEMSKW